MKDKTSIVITHHLGTISKADVIFVVKDSNLVERGTHQELLAAGGVYAELHAIQFQTQEDRPIGEPAVAQSTKGEAAGAKPSPEPGPPAMPDIKKP